MAEDEVYRDDPEAGTVHDWFGQEVARDSEVADEAMAEAGGDEEEAERLFEERAEGEAHYRETHRRAEHG